MTPRSVPESNQAPAVGRASATNASSSRSDSQRPGPRGVRSTRDARAATKPIAKSTEAAATSGSSSSLPKIRPAPSAPPAMSARHQAGAGTSARGTTRPAPLPSRCRRSLRIKSAASTRAKPTAIATQRDERTGAGSGSALVRASEGASLLAGAEALAASRIDGLASTRHNTGSPRATWDRTSSISSPCGVR
jgi:hypothetical protein